MPLTWEGDAWINIQTTKSKVVLTDYTTSPEVSARMKKVQERLNAKGLRSISLTWNWAELLKGKTSMNDLKTSVCEIMESFLDGKTTKFESFNEILPNS